MQRQREREIRSAARKRFLTPALKYRLKPSSAMLYCALKNLIWVVKTACNLTVFMCVAGVAQVLNRLDGKPFDDLDQRLFEV